MRSLTVSRALACLLVLSGCTEKVVSPGGTAASVVLAPDEGTFLVGDTLRMVATVLDDEGGQLTHRMIVWASSDPSVATVAGGLVTGVGPGPVTIYVAAEALADSAVLTVVEPFRALQVDAGPGFTCAVTQSADAYCWGESWGGTLGNGLGYGAVRRPSRVVGGISWAAVSTGGLGWGSGFTCGVSTAGVGYCWGNNDTGIYGTWRNSYIPLALPDTGRLLSVATSERYTCVLGVGRVRCFMDWLEDPAQGTTWAPPTFSSLTTGGGHQCGLTSVGAAYCWGSNGAGQLGDGTSTSRFAPTEVVGGRIFAAIDGGGNSTCAVDAAGAGWCWGANESGQLGDSTLVDHASPGSVAGGLRFTAMSVAKTHSCGVSEDGTAYCWGDNSHGQLGDGTLTDRPAPVPVAGGVRFSKISAGRTHTCGISVAGIVYCWGSNDAGEVGDDSTTERLTPVAVWAP